MIKAILFVTEIMLTLSPEEVQGHWGFTLLISRNLKYCDIKFTVINISYVRRQALEREERDTYLRHTHKHLSQKREGYK